jgi:hypothetical protein
MRLILKLVDHVAVRAECQARIVAVGRALLADPRILIFDEATSNIDRPTELLIEHALDQLLHGRTSIIIAHRLSTARRALRSSCSTAATSSNKEPRPSYSRLMARCADSLTHTCSERPNTPLARGRPPRAAVADRPLRAADRAPCWETGVDGQDSVRQERGCCTSPTMVAPTLAPADGSRCRCLLRAERCFGSGSSGTCRRWSGCRGMYPSHRSRGHRRRSPRRAPGLIVNVGRRESRPTFADRFACGRPDGKLKTPPAGS